MTYLDTLVILSAWLLSDSLYVLTTTASAGPPHFSTWTLHSGERHIKAALERPENTSLHAFSTAILANFSVMSE